MKWIPRRTSVVLTLVLGFVVFSLPASIATEAAPQVTVSGPPAGTPPQTPPRPPEPAPPTPDTKAFNDANRLTDPDKKVDALRAFVMDFPDSARKTAAHQAIFDTLVKSRPGERDKILEHAQAIIDSTPETIRASSYSRVATRLVEATIAAASPMLVTTHGTPDDIASPTTFGKPSVHDARQKRSSAT